MRYEQQGFEVPVAVPPEMLAARDLAQVLRQYHDDHERMYGVRFAVPVELVALRIVATGRTEPMQTATPTTATGESQTGTRPCYFAGAWHDTPVHDRTRLHPGDTLPGPAIINQYDSTTVVLPRHRLEVDPHGNMLIWPETRQTKEQA